MNDGLVAVLRQCERCNTHRSIDEFVGLSHMCTPCLRGTSNYRAAGRYTPARSIVITAQGREAIREVQPAA